MAVQETTVAAPEGAAVLQLVPKARMRGRNASDRQKGLAHAALGRLLAVGWTCAEVAKRLGIEPNNVQRFHATRGHLGADRCAALTRLGRELARAPRDPRAAAPTVTPPPVRDVPDSLPATLGASLALPSAPVAQGDTIALTLDAVQCAAVDARLSALRAALPGVSISRADVVRGLLETALKGG